LGAWEKIGGVYKNSTLAEGGEEVAGLGLRLIERPWPDASVGPDTPGPRLKCIRLRSEG